MSLLPYSAVLSSAIRRSLAIPVLLCVLTLASCGNSPEKARKELAALGKDYTPEAFVKAAYDGDVVAVKLFLGAGMSVNAKSEAGATAILSASLNGHTEVLKLLLANGADMNSTDANGIPALTFSIYSGNVGALKTLLERGADPNRLSATGMTPLMTAASKGQTDMMDLLLMKGASIDATNLAGITALSVAVTEGRTNSVALLLDKKAKWWLQDTNRMTASDHAIRKWEAAITREHRSSVGNATYISNEKRMDFKAMTFELTNAPNAILALLRSHGVGIGTPWLVERYAAEAKEALIDTSYAERKAEDLDFKGTRLLLSQAFGWLDALKFHPEYVGWFRAEIAGMIHRQWVTANTGLQSFDDKSAKAQSLNRSYGSLYGEVRQGVPEKYLKHLPPDVANEPRQ